MNLGLLSLLCILLAIGLGFLRKMNTGLVCIGLALLVGRAGGMTDLQIMTGFNSALFLTLLGVTYLFSIAQANGTLELVARRAVSCAGRRASMVPLAVFVFSAFLSAIGPGTIPVIALMMPFSVALASEMELSPLLFAQMGILGAAAGGISPIAPTGIIGATLAAQQGITGIEMAYFGNSLVALSLWAVALYLVLGGHRIRTKPPASIQNLPAFDTSQVVTLVGIAVLVVSVLFFRVNVGLMAFVIATTLVLLGITHETRALTQVPWGTLLLVCGVGVLMEVSVSLGGIRILAAFLARFMTESTASAVMALTAGVMSWFSSTSGVVMPTLIPTVTDIVVSVGGSVSKLDLISAITNTAHVTGSSPVSTGGALALAAYAATTAAPAHKQHRLFVQMFVASAGGLLFLSALAWLGLYRVF